MQHRAGTDPISTIDPISGAATGSALSQTISRAVEIEERKYRARGGAWTEARVAVMVAASDLSWTPALHDHGTWAGKTGKVTAINVLAPAGTAIAYEFAVGA